jgi:hypothetical protein
MWKYFRKNKSRLVHVLNESTVLYHTLEVEAHLADENNPWQKALQKLIPPAKKDAFLPISAPPELVQGTAAKLSQLHSEKDAQARTSQVASTLFQGTQG